MTTASAPAFDGRFWESKAGLLSYPFHVDFYGAPFPPTSHGRRAAINTIASTQVAAVPTDGKNMGCTYQDWTNRFWCQESATSVSTWMPDLGEHREFRLGRSGIEVRLRGNWRPVARCQMRMQAGEALRQLLVSR